MGIAKSKLVKCLICGEIFDSSIEFCPVCGAGKENFVEVEENKNSYKNDTNETFVILGNGAAGINAAETIRSKNKTCKIIMISNENVLSYNRPMLTKTIMAEFDKNKILVHDANWYKENQIQNILGVQIEKIDVNAKQVILNDNQKIKYDKCIYALGADSFIPPIKGNDKKEVISIRKISDIEKIIKLLPKVKNVVVIGGGVLGLEAAWELKKSQCNVTVLELSDKIMKRQLDFEGGNFLKQIVEENNINLKLGVKIDEIQGESSVTGVKINGNESIPAELVILSCGISPNIKIAKEAGIDVKRSIVVNEKMETNIKDIYACGDCAEYKGINYGIWPQAVEMAKVAGANAAGDNTYYETVDAALTFNGVNTSLYSIGDNGKNPDKKYSSVEFRDSVNKIYKKFYFSDSILCGSILIGDTKSISILSEYIKQGKSFKDVFKGELL